MKLTILLTKIFLALFIYINSVFDCSGFLPILDQ